VYNPEPGNNSSAFRESIEKVANKVGIASIETPSGDSSDIDHLIRSLKDKPNSGLIFLPDAITSFRRVQIAALVAQCELPAVYPFRYFVTAGGLICYGIDQADLYLRAASYVDRILKGSKPADLPIQQPTKFELVINLKAAKAIGLTIPESFLLHADEVIE
jgi:putative tryptophan/tyrosine transport system substrate-binding protein